MPHPVKEPALARFLGELELSLKQKSGVVPEDVLCATRDRAMSLLTASPRGDGARVGRDSYENLVRSLGSPSIIAEQSAEGIDVPQPSRVGNAPGWRICCTRCGRSAPAGSVGITRLGAASWHKYVGGRCRGCNRIRWMRLLKDLDQTNLSEQLGSDLNGDQLRAAMHRPWTMVALILVAVATILTCVTLLLAALFGLANLVA